MTHTKLEIVIIYAREEAYSTFALKGLEGGNKPEASVALLFTLTSTAREKVAKKERDLLSLFPPQPNTHRLPMITNETVLKIFSSECLQRFN